MSQTIELLILIQKNNRVIHFHDMNYLYIYFTA